LNLPGVEDLAPRRPQFRRITDVILRRDDAAVRQYADVVHMCRWQVKLRFQSR
jgi:hypothetical protein